MAFKLGKERPGVWTERYPEDNEIRFKIKPITPLLNEQITARHLSASLEQIDGKQSVRTNIKSFGVSREQAKAIVVDWEGIVGAEDMLGFSGKPLPCTEKNVALLFDEWDEGGALAAFVVKQSNDYNKLREEALGNSEKPSATS